MPTWSLRTRLFVFFFLALNFLLLLTSSGRVRTRDELSADLQAESIATRGSTATPQAGNFYFYGKFDRAGQPQPPYGAAHAALLVPWYAAGRVLRAVVPGIPPNARDAALDGVVVASSATFAALACALIFLILSQLGVSNLAALLAASMAALATPLFSYSSWLYSEPLTAALFLATAAVLFRGGDAAITAKQAALAGLLLGIALWVRPAHVIAAPVFLLAILFRDRQRAWRAAFIAATIVGCFGLAYLARNLHLFGNPFDFGYPQVSDGGKNINSFSTPIFTGLFGLLLSPGKSVFLFAPPILLAIPGLRRLARLDKGLAFVAAAIPLVYLFFYAGYTQWEGGFCVGPRYMVPSIALLCLGLGPMLGAAGSQVRAAASPRPIHWARRAALVLFLLGVGVQTITAATSYLEDQANGNYYDTQYNYRMDYDPLVTMSRQLAHYVASPESAAIGRGFDRWFVFLPKAGIAGGTVAAVFIAELAGCLLFSLLLVKQFREAAGAASPAVSRAALAPGTHAQATPRASGF